MTRSSEAESKKTWKKKEVELPVPTLVTKEVHYKNQDWTFGLKKKNFFNFDYTVGLVFEYGNKYNL